MPRSFDKERWLTEATDCYTRTSQHDKHRALSKLRTDLECIDGLGRLDKWCMSQDMVIKFVSAASGMWSSEFRTVFVTTNAKPEYQLILTLHECGHMLVESYDTDEYLERYGNGYISALKLSQHSFIHRVDCLAEEFEAWHMGWDLSKKLGIELDREAFVRWRNSSLRSYIKWVTVATL